MSGIPYGNNKAHAAAESESEEFRSLHRRSTDLPEKLSLRDGGSIRLQMINTFVIMVSGLSSFLLLGTIQKNRTLIDALPSVESADIQVLYRMMQRQQILTGLLLLAVILEISAVVGLVLRPLDEYIRRIRRNKMLPLRGSYELRYLAKAYNMMFEENLRRNEELRYKVEHDALTGLYNRGAYEKLLESHQRQGNIALLWIDVDKFKGVNDVYGHDVGDKILQKVARVLVATFRVSDYACRTGGDEFAVIMTDIDERQQKAVEQRVESVQKDLLNTTDGLPETTISVGVAFSGQCREGDSLFKMADKALYRVKEAGRNGCAFFTDADRDN